MSKTLDPFHTAATKWPDWHIGRCDLQGRAPELIARTIRIILVDTQQWDADPEWAQAHAVAHLELGHLQGPGSVTTAQENAADKLARKMLGRKD